MSTAQAAPNGDRRLSPADVQNVRFNRGSVMRPGYAEVASGTASAAHGTRKRVSPAV